MSDKERLTGSGYQLPPWKREVADFFSEKDLGFTKAAGLVAIILLRVITAAELVKEGIEKLGQTIKRGGKRKNPENPPPDSGINLTAQKYRRSDKW